MGIFQGPGLEHFPRELHGAALSGNWRNSLLFFCDEPNQDFLSAAATAARSSTALIYGPQCMLPRARGQPFSIEWYGTRDERCGCDDSLRLLEGQSINFSAF